MTKINLERIARVAAMECIRQNVGLDRLHMLLSAYNDVMNLWGDPSERLYVGSMSLIDLAYTIEPSNKHWYRSTPVTFLDGGDSANAQLIPERMRDLLQEIPMIVKYDREHGGDAQVESWIREFLWVHPFTDGNGRTAWVLYNWMRGTMGTPAPLPDLFGAGYLDSTGQPPIGFDRKIATGKSTRKIRPENS